MKIKIASIFAVVVFAVAAACSSKPSETAAENQDTTATETVTPEPAAPVEADTTVADTTATAAPAH
ncbi:hypothetical protein [Dawidia soli]|uniref:Uncharacterized protein n=1 Tax=Dawidia soli TaxID=2782352 RepID=A0AAP2DJ30_9BACT|nr:hypothetical protein [Dawidia soli]MBT1690357.1 hypothetical protein [Dawidia soli]